MLLAIDAGNTNIVFAVFDGAMLRGSWRASTHARWTADEYAVWFTHLLALKRLKLEDIDACIISSVVPGVLFSLSTLASDYCHVKPRIVGEPGLDLGIGVLLDRPDEAGADRLVNAVAAKNVFAPPLIIIDFGTATTFDVLNAAGDFAGGVIAPGINLSLDALSNAAAKLPRIAIEKTPRVIGSDTVSAMQSGIFWGYVGLIEGLVTRITKEFGAKMTVVATGGLAPLFAGATNVIGAVDADLTLTGLRLIYERNKSG
jgi:type III pantothenate kinase